MFIFSIKLTETLTFRLDLTEDGPIRYNDVTMGAIASQVTSLTIVYSTVYPDPDQRKHQSSAPLGIVGGIHRGPVNSPHKRPVTRKMFPFDDVIMLRKASHLSTALTRLLLYKLKYLLKTSMHDFVPIIYRWLSTRLR